MLYRVWHDIVQRTRGRATADPHSFEGVPLGFANYGEFRKWALANGFSKTKCSPDRIRAKLGYVPGNIRFVTKAENWRAAQLRQGKLGLYEEDYEVPF